VNGIHDNYDLGLIIPTQDEFEYIREAIPFRLLRNKDKDYWYEFAAPGPRRGIAHVLFDVGLVATASAAARLLELFSPEVLAIVGIGGSLSPDLRLGDVVVGSVIQEYLKAARIAPDGDSGTIFQPSGDGWPLPERLRRFANHFRYSTGDRHDRWLHFARLRGLDAELPFATTPGARREPVYSVQPIASGDAVVDDPAFKDWLLSHDRKRAVIEMEAAGAARAVKDYDQDVALLVMRGISDFADGRKAALDAVVAADAVGAWRRYAAQNAIELLFAFLASPDFPWRAPVAPEPDQPDGGGPAAPAAGPAPQGSRRAWDFFMQATHLVGTGIAGVELARSLRAGPPAGSDSDHGPGHGSDRGPSHGGAAPGHEPAHDPGHAPAHGPAHEPTHGPGHEPANEPGHDAAHALGEYDDSGYHELPIEPDGHADTHHHLIHHYE
jgi:nucleoside phosphorylase